jgi:hypothetical protein
MADNIVGGLFGIDPAQYDMQQRQQRQQEFSRDFQTVQLSPLEQSKLAILQGTRAFGRGAGQLLGGEDPQLQKVSAIKQLSSQFDLTSATGMRDFARSLQAQYPQEAMMAAKRADELETSGLGRQKTQVDIQRAEGLIAKDELSAKNEEKLRSELANLPANATEQQVIEVVRKYGSPDKILQILQRSQDAKDKRAAAGSGSGIGTLTPAQKAVDNKFSKEYNDFVTGGGSTAITKNLQMLDDAIKIIESEPDGSTSGKIVGLADKTGTLSYTYPKAAEAKDLIGGVAQSNLRAILGGQFAAKEGEQLLARAYNTAQPKADNLNRLRALRTQIQDAGQAKSNASQYYEENGTLKGFKGTYSVSPTTGSTDNNDPLGLRKK